MRSLSENASFFIYSIIIYLWAGLFAPIHLGHAHVALVTLLGHILASVEEVGGRPGIAS